MMLKGFEIEGFTIADVLSHDHVNEVYKINKSGEKSQLVLKIWKKPKPAGRKEIQTLRMLSRNYKHPFVQTFVNSFAFEGRNCLLTTFVGERSLKKMVREDGVVKEEGRACLYTACGLSALHFLHECAHVVHGDVSLSNLVLDQHGYVVLIDFGSSHVVGACKKSAFHSSNYATTRATTHATTRATNSNKNAYNEHTLSYQNDYKQLALCLFEMLTMKEKFVSQDRACTQLLRHTQRVEAFMLHTLCNLQPLCSRQLMEHPFFSPISWTRLKNRRCDLKSLATYPYSSGPHPV